MNGASSVHPRMIIRTRNTGNAFQKCEMALHIRTVLPNPVASA